MRIQKIKATLYVAEDAALLSNRVFFSESLYGMKNSNFMLLSLRNQLAEYGIILSTQDIHPPQESALVISLDTCLPFQNAFWLAGRKNYLLISELPTYCPYNWNLSNHKVFDKVFTYNVTLTDKKHYSHYYFAIDLESFSEYTVINKADFQKRKLAVLIAASFSPLKPKNKSNSLLYERYLTLAWFAKNRPDDFDLYSRIQ